MKSNVIVPAKLDSMARYTSFKEYCSIQKIYKEILGTNYIDHFSINVVPKSTNKMLIFSINPNIAYKVYENPQGVNQDLAISPYFYENKDFYFWDDCYRKKDLTQIRLKKEQPFGIKAGAVIVKEIKDVYYLLSFATKTSSDNFKSDIYLSRCVYNEMGEFCLDKMKCNIEKYFSREDLMKKTSSIHNLKQ